MALKGRSKKPQKGKKSKKAIKKKQSMSFKEFSQSFQSLDNNNYGSWPVVVKITILLLILILAAVLTYFLLVSPKMDDIRAAENEKQALLDTYREKESKARHLDEYKNQIAQMETEFNSLLDQLPKDTRVPELVRSLNMTGVGSNIRFRKITVKEEKKREFFIEQAIEIEAVGDYHQFGTFISGIAGLPRIMTIHDFDVTVKEGKSDDINMEEIDNLELTLVTKTYRSKDIKADDVGEKTNDKAK